MKTIIAILLITVIIAAPFTGFWAFDKFIRYSPPLLLENPTVQLKLALSITDRIDILNPNNNTLIKQINNQKEIDILTKNIEFAEQVDCYWCMCMGSHLLKFYSRNKLITACTYHGESLRGYYPDKELVYFKGLPGFNMNLTEDSRILVGKFILINLLQTAE